MSRKVESKKLAPIEDHAESFRIDFAFASDPCLVRQLDGAVRQHRYPGAQIYANGNDAPRFWQQLVEHLATLVPVVSMRAKLPELTIAQQIAIVQRFVERAVAPLNLPYSINIRRYAKKEVTKTFLYLHLATSKNPTGPFADLETAKKLVAHWEAHWLACLDQAQRAAPWWKT